VSVARKYERFRAGKWHLTVLPEHWNQELQEEVLALAEGEIAAKHPQTLELAVAAIAGGKPLYLKVFHPPAGPAHLKNLFRKSKASRFLHQGNALSEAGFRVPVTIAVGELRSWRFLQRAFVLTLAVSGQSLASHMMDYYAGRIPRMSFVEKTAALRSLGELIRKFHDRGFVHGDLVPSNIFISEWRAGKPEFCFMDNDRTRCYGRWLPQPFWKRNLVQLNRFPLPGISLQDRVRFFLAYRGQSSCQRRDRKLLRWLEQRTRRRRRECDRVTASGSFRMLMHWTPSAKGAEPVMAGPKTLEK
jgi:lipopolysaccharide kinase (Kdo/WaaP) family protein